MGKENEETPRMLDGPRCTDEVELKKSDTVPETIIAKKRRPLWLFLEGGNQREWDVNKRGGGWGGISVFFFASFPKCVEEKT